MPNRPTAPRGAAAYTPTWSNRPLKRVDVPAGAADSVVVVVTEVQGVIVHAGTGIVVAADSGQPVVFVDARPPAPPMSGLPGTASERNTTAFVGRSSQQRKVRLELSPKSLPGATLYSAESSQLPKALPRTTDMVVSEGLPLLLVGCEIEFVDDEAVPKLVAVEAIVGGMTWDDEGRPKSFTIQTRGPINLRSGVVFTTEGKPVAYASVHPDWPRSTSGYRNFRTEPLESIGRMGDR